MHRKKDFFPFSFDIMHIDFFIIAPAGNSRGLLMSGDTRDPHRRPARPRVRGAADQSRTIRAAP